MSASADPPPNLTDPALRAARRLRMVERLGEIGMDLTELLQQQAHAAVAADPASTLEGLDLKFARLSRAVRLTLALEERLDAAANAPAAAPRPLRPTPWEAVGLSPEDYDAKHRAGLRRDLAYEAIEKAIELERDPAEQDRLILELAERFDEDRDEAATLSQAPIGAIIAAICRDLGLRPDWRRVDTDALDLDEPTLAALRLGRFDPPPPPTVDPEPDPEPDLALDPQPPPAPNDLASADLAPNPFNPAPDAFARAPPKPLPRPPAQAPPWMS